MPVAIEHHYEHHRFANNSVEYLRNSTKLDMVIALVVGEMSMLQKILFMSLRYAYL